MLFIAAENEIAKIIRTNETIVSVVYEPTEAQQLKTSKDGLQGQFVVQYDVDRSSIERKGGEIHAIKKLSILFLSIYLIQCQIRWSMDILSISLPPLFYRRFQNT